MAEVFAWSFLAGNPDVRSGTVTLLDNTSSTVVITVPAKQRWLVLFGQAKNGDDVARNIRFYVTDSSDNVIGYLGFAENVPAGERVVFPNQEAHRLNAGFVLAILEAGEKLKITWDSGGASSGGDSDYAIKIMVVRL